MYNNKFRNLVGSYRHMTNPIFCKVKQLIPQKRTIYNIYLVYDIHS